MSNSIHYSSPPGYLAVRPRRDFRRGTTSEVGKPSGPEIYASFEPPRTAAHRLQHLRKSGLSSRLPMCVREDQKILRTYLQEAKAKRRRAFVRSLVKVLLLLLLVAGLVVLNLTF